MKCALIIQLWIILSSSHAISCARLFKINYLNLITNRKMNPESLCLLPGKCIHASTQAIVQTIGNAKSWIVVERRRKKNAEAQMHKPIIIRNDFFYLWGCAIWETGGSFYWQIRYGQSKFVNSFCLWLRWKRLWDWNLNHWASIRKLEVAIVSNVLSQQWINRNQSVKLTQ